MHLSSFESDGSFPGLSVWRQGGWVGVDLFFVLSGFLIAGLLFREYERYGQIDFRRFFVRRGLKIYPAFYVFFLVTVVVRWLLEEPLFRRALASEALFLQNYGGATLWGHTWSLAVEEHFYFLLPIFLFLLTRCARGSNPFRSLPYWILGLCTFVLLLRLANAWLSVHRPLRNIYVTHFRIDALLFGVLLSYWSMWRKDQFRNLCKAYRVPLLLLGIGLLTPDFILDLRESGYLLTFGFTCNYLGAGMILSGSLAYPMSGGVLLRVLGFVGARSYSIYLWHAAVERWLMAWLRSQGTGFLPAWLWVLLYVVGCIAAGTALAWIVEYPILRLRDRLFPSRISPLAVGPANTAAAVNSPAPVTPFLSPEASSSLDQGNATYPDADREGAARVLATIEGRAG